MGGIAQAFILCVSLFQCLVKLLIKSFFLSCSQCTLKSVPTRQLSCRWTVGSSYLLATAKRWKNSNFRLCSWSQLLQTLGQIFSSLSEAAASSFIVNNEKKTMQKEQTRNRCVTHPCSRRVCLSVCQSAAAAATDRSWRSRTPRPAHSSSKTKSLLGSAVTLGNSPNHVCHLIVTFFIDWSVNRLFCFVFWNSSTCKKKKKKDFTTAVTHHSAVILPCCFPFLP